MKPSSTGNMKKDIYVVKVKPKSGNSHSCKTEEDSHSKYENCQDICQQEFDVYGRETSVHGLKRMLGTGTGRVER